jgi:hypothetical protein
LSSSKSQRSLLRFYVSHLNTCPRSEGLFEHTLQFVTRPIIPLKCSIHCSLVLVGMLRLAGYMACWHSGARDSITVCIVSSVQSPLKAITKPSAIDLMFAATSDATADGLCGVGGNASLRRKPKDGLLDN